MHLSRLLPKCLSTKKNRNTWGGGELVIQHLCTTPPELSALEETADAFEESVADTPFTFAGEGGTPLSDPLAMDHVDHSPEDIPDEPLKPTPLYEPPKIEAISKTFDIFRCCVDLAFLDDDNTYIDAAVEDLSE